MLNSFRVRETDDNFAGCWVVADGSDSVSTRCYINVDGEVIGNCFTYKDKDLANAVLNAYFGITLKSEAPKMREFEGGATRDTSVGKLDYVKALSPIVLRRYVQYLDKHRLQADGSMREFDNWKHGIPQETYLSSLGRHFVDVWLLAGGYTTEDNHGPVEIEDALAAIIFNASGYLHEILKQKTQPTETKPGYGGNVI